jgi:opacity protein-like surface antigen
MNCLFRTSICIAVAILSTATATAQEQAFNFEITPYGAYRFGGQFDDLDSDVSIKVDDSSSYGIIFNARHSPITQWEILYSRQETRADSNGLDLGDTSLDLSIEYLQAGGTYLWDGDQVRPFLAATLGLTRIEVRNEGFDDDSFFSFGVGLGLQIRPTKRLGIRLEARGFGTLLDSDTDIFCKTGPDNNICAVRIEGTVMWQLETFAGLVFRF